MSNFVAGQWNTICDRCGLEFKSDKLKSEWTGLKVCNECYEPRHPQTLIKVPEEHNTPPWTRPEQGAVYVAEPTYSFDFSATPLYGEGYLLCTLSASSNPSGLVKSSLPTSFKWTLTDTLFGVPPIVMTTTSSVITKLLTNVGLYDVTLEVYNGETLLDTETKTFYIRVDEVF